PYNLPPHLCMKYDYMFLCLIILGPEHPRKHLNVMLEPLVDELKKLWEGVEAYDCYKKERFNLRVAYLWSIHDFMAYGIFAGWSCHGKLTCPICGKDTDCFRLEFGGKICYFDCHRCFLPLDHPFRFEANQFRKDTIVTKGPPKRLSGAEIHAALDNLKPDGTGYLGFGIEHNWTHKCSLWELPYTEALILMHNIDVMHQERNVAESIISTCMDFPDKTKDNIKARKDLQKICNRPSLVLLQSGAKPRASFCLKSKQNKEVMVWLKNLKFPDGYAARFRRSVNLRTGKMNGLKSHDYHIIMERLLPVMFRGYLNNDVWTALAELRKTHWVPPPKVPAREEDKILIVPCGDESWIDASFQGQGRHTQVNKVLGSICKYLWPGVVMEKGVEVPCMSWDQYGLAFNAEHRNAQGAVWHEFWKRYRLPEDGILTIHWIEIKFSDSVPWMASNEAGWRAVCKYWATNGFKGVSLRNSSNRGHDVHHRYGGDGHVRLAKRMEASSGVTPSDVQVYLRGHRGSDPTNPEQLCSQSAAERVASYGASMMSEHGQDYDWMNQPIDPQVVYASGGGKPHGRYPMFGSVIDSTHQIALGQRPDFSAMTMPPPPPIPQFVPTPQFSWPTPAPQ
ncbi:hypothetical protein ACJX0J_042228, partial [Zea mays]